MPSVNVFHGDMFAQPCDLIIIPCSTVPTISRFVYERLERFELPIPTETMELGQVLIVAAGSIKQVASQLAFAASVSGASSTKKAIVNIIREVAEHCNANPWLTDVSSPVLGTGAGKLDHRLSLVSMADTFLRYCKTEARLNVFSFVEVPESWLASLTTNMSGTTVRTSGHHSAQSNLVEATEANGKEIKPPRTFISYSHSSEEHKKWVKNLATRLRQHGIDARIDQFHLNKADEIAVWMNRELTLADKVLVICDTVYFQKFEGQVGGASWEATMILGDMQRNQRDRRHVAIQIGTDPNECVPMFLRGKYNFRALNYEFANESFDELVEYLFDVEPEIPGLGPPPPTILRRLQRQR